MTRSSLKSLTALSLLLVLAVTVSPIGWRPHTMVSDDFDRAAAFALIGLISMLAFPRRWRLVAICLVASAGVIELLQLAAPGRHARLDDAVVKAFGAAVGIAMGRSLVLANRLLVGRPRHGRRLPSQHFAEVAGALAPAMPSGSLPLLVAMQRMPVNSRLIEGVFFNPEDGQLHLRFRNGDERVFEGVAQADAEALVAAPSPGSYYVEKIKPRYRRRAA